MKKYLLALSAFALLGTTATVKAANEVKLIEVFSVVQSNVVPAVTYTHFEAVVANLGYAKSVAAHTKLANGSWVDIPLSYNRAADSGREVWSTDVVDFGGASRFGNSVQFALSYTVNGKTYWDNNNNANYNIVTNGGVILNGVNVYALNPTTTFNAGYYFGAVTLNNIGFAKTVKVVYTTDNWATVQNANASFDSKFWAVDNVYLTNPNAYNFEEWSFVLPLAANATQLQYAISYTVNGTTYWDNNFGQNYRATLIK